MKRFYTLIVLTIALFPALQYGQDREQPRITVEDIYENGRFDSYQPTGLNSTEDGLHYTLQVNNRIEKFSYESGKLEAVLFDGRNYPELGRFSSYTLNFNEDKILLETRKEQIYRHSYKASFYVFDLINATLVPLSDQGKQQLATFSPDGTQVAFVRDNNLYIKDLISNRESQVTCDGKRNEIINGAPDWVYEEEFAFSKGFNWSPDSRRLAFYRFDESRVKQFSMTLFGVLYPEISTFKYPKAGEDNSLVTIRVFDLESGETTTMDVGPEPDQYIPRIQWTSDPEMLSILRLNRLQNRLDILHASAKTGASSVIYSEENLYYISEPSDQTLTYLPDGKTAILISEKDGYYHLYKLDCGSGALKSITAGPFDVESFLGYDPGKNTLYYTSYEESSVEIHLYSIQLDGRGKRKLSSRPGSNTASFSKSYDYYILTHSSANSPYQVTLHNRKGKMIRLLEDNEPLRKNMKEYAFAPVEFLTVPTASGLELNAWMIKPVDFDPDKEYPLFMFVYGGPESQKVVDGWIGSRAPWYQMLAQQGYIVACVDNRGTNGRGEAFRKATYMQLGNLETIDQVEAAQWFAELDYIDRERIGMFGWSYGGFMTSLCMTKGNGTFKMGIAVAPVTSWRYYDTVYTERFMRTPRENPEGYDDNSPINYAHQLRGKFLLIHGMGDDNVHFQNTVDFTEALVQSNIQFEMQFYPNKNHGISGGNTSLHIYQRMTDFIIRNL
jgi:dipeptidyl-peptidase-4